MKRYRSAEAFREEGELLGFFLSWAESGDTCHKFGSLSCVTYGISGSRILVLSN